MSSVLVFGATGIIGFDVALAFLNKGFKVYGIARTQDKADLLSKHEIIPVIANAKETEKWENVAKSVDVVVEALADYDDATSAQHVLKKLKEISTAKPSLHVIYTSGVWLYGPSNQENVSHTENSPYNSYDFVKYHGRVEHQTQYLSFNSTIIIPGLVYGRGGSLSADYFRQVPSGEYKFAGSNIWIPFVHTSDLAQLYLLSALNPGKSRGQLFNAVTYNGKREDIIYALAHVSKVPVKSITYHPFTNPFEECLSKSQRVSGQKAKNILGWNPVQPTLEEGAERYYLAYKQYIAKN